MSDYGWVKDSLREHAMDALTPLDSLCGEALQAIELLEQERDILRLFLSGARETMEEAAGALRLMGLGQTTPRKDAHE